MNDKNAKGGQSPWKTSADAQIKIGKSKKYGVRPGPVVHFDLPADSRQISSHSIEEPIDLVAVEQIAVKVASEKKLLGWKGDRLIILNGAPLWSRHRPRAPSGCC